MKYGHKDFQIFFDSFLYTRWLYLLRAIIIMFLSHVFDSNLVSMLMHIQWVALVHETQIVLHPCLCRFVLRWVLLSMVVKVVLGLCMGPLTIVLNDKMGILSFNLVILGAKICITNTKSLVLTIGTNILIVNKIFPFKFKLITSSLSSIPYPPSLQWFSRNSTLSDFVMAQNSLFCL